jgi:glycosyltransferase involved in cell wall biosynthesis
MSYALHETPKALEERQGALSTSSVNPRPRGGRRICMVVYAFYENDTRVMQYADALVERGDRVDVIALRRSDGLPAYEVLRGVHVHRIQSRTVNEKGVYAYGSRILRFTLAAAWHLRRLHRQHGYDLIHVHNVPDTLVFAAAYPKWKRVPIILDIHDLLPEFFASKFRVEHSSRTFRLLTWMEQLSAAFATHVIVANDLWCERLAARSSRPEKCSVVRNRPDLSIFRGSVGKRTKPAGKFLMTYPGSLNWHQGLDVAIAAFAKVADQMPDAEFHIYGEGAAKSSLIALVKDLRLEDRIVFHDMLPSRDVAEVMAMTDLAIEPKRSTSAFGNEALSTKILEFMCLGVPVIASRTAIHQYYYDESIIQYYSNDDAGELATLMLRLKNDPARRNAMAARASRYAELNTWDARKGDYLWRVEILVGASTATLSPSE